MPTVDFFVERTAEMAQLTAWLTATTGSAASAQLISILGMGGMGKTTLAAAVTKAVAPSFAVVIWRSLLNAPPLSELVRDWLQILSRQSLTAPPDALDEQLRLLLTYLQQERCLLVLDNVESIFAADTPNSQPQSRAGVTRPGYEGYDQLFQRLATSDHQSCLLLTSREQPYALLRSGRQAQAAGRIQVLPLTGLDHQTGQVLLQNNGLHTSASEAAQLVENYSGNPLALQIVASTIADFFGGDVAAFQQEEGQIFDGMRVVLDQQFARLSSLEREVLIWLAIEREAITVPALRSNFVQPVTTSELLEALQALQNRSLLEKTSAGLTLQNVIIEYTTEYLVAQVCGEILDFGVWSLDSSTHELPSESQNLKSQIQNLFLNRFALLKAQSKKFIRQSQARIFLQSVIERLVATLGRAQIVARIPQLLDALRAAGGQKGYAGGNLLNLLVQMGEDLIGYDFSHLPVWQADLSGLTVVTANFTGADLGRSTFTAGITLDKIAFQPTGELWAAGLQNGVLGLWRMVEGQLTDAFQHAGNQRGPLVFSPNGTLLATTTDDYRINLWSTTSGECLQTLTGQPSAVYTLALSDDGILLASLGTDHVVYLWDLRTGRCIQRLPGYEQGADALTFSPDGQLLATGGGDGLIQLWDTRSTAAAGRRVAAWQAHRQPLGALAFSPDGRWLASGSHAGEIRLWQAVPIAAEQSQGGAGEEQAALPYRAGPICQGHTSIIRALLFVPTSEPATYLLASACAHSTVRIWSRTGHLRATLLGHTNTVFSLSASPDGQQLASAGADKQIFLWDVATGQALNSQQAYRSAFRALAFSPDGLLASGGADQIVRLWQVDREPNAAAVHATEEQVGAQRHVETSQVRHLLRGHTRFICSLAFSPDGQTLASGDADGTIRLWDRASGQAWQTLRDQQGSVRALAFAPTHSLLGQQHALLASAGADRIIRLWSVATQQRREARCQRQLSGHEDEIVTIAFDPHGQRLVSGCADGSIRIWDIHSGTTLHQMTGHTAPITAVTLSPDGKTVASSCFDQTIRLWDLTTGACLHVERGAHVGTNAVAFSPDGEYLAYTGTGYALYLWSWHTHATTSLLHGHMSDVEALGFSPTTGHLASCSAAGTIRLWDLTSKRCYQILRPPGPYAGMKITGVTGISEAQKAALRALGAVDGTEDDKVTSDRVTSTSSVTDSSSHPVTLPPAHPVTPAPLLDWAEMPMVDFFVERTAEVAQLTAWLTPTTAGGVSAQLISILGMGGMGKTTLAAMVTKAMAPRFAVVIWRSLLNAPTLSELVRGWLQTLSRQTLTVLPESLDEQLRLLLPYLQQERCLLVLDNVESIFAADIPSPAGTAQPQSRAGVTRPGYEGYDQLFQRLASSDHQSCLLLTSREQPYALLRIAAGQGRQTQPAARLQVLPLAGLDQAAGQALLASNGLRASAAETAQLVENYSGNPLALQIVASTIADFFGGDVAAFQAEDGQLFDGMRLVLDQQFARLSPLEREILIWLAIEREPITVPMLRSNFIQSVATAPLLEALQALQNRSLLEKRDSGLTLQNVIIEYSTEYLVAQVCQEIVDDKVTRWQGDKVTESSSHPLTPSPSHPVTLSFFNRFALLKAQAKAYVRQSQARLILQPVAQQLVNRLGQTGLLTRIQEVLALLRTHAPHTPGYAAGNLLNLLLALDIDLTDYDFSSLCVWQPYLREKTLPQFNFTNADLRGATFTDTFDIVRALAYSPDGRWLAAGTSDGEIRLWRASDGQLLANVKGHGDIVSWLGFLDDGKTLISYSHDLALAVWQFGPEVTDAAADETGEVVTLRLLYRNSELSNLTNLVAFHPQNELLVFGTERGWLCFWHLGTRRQLSEQTLNVREIHTLRFSPDGKILAMGAADRRIHLWAVDAGTGRLALRQTLAETPAVARDLSFRPDGRTLASGHEDGAIYLWALDAAGQAAQVLTGHRAPVYRLVFSPDGQVLASGSDDQSVRLWAMGGQPTAVSAQPLARFDDHRGWVRALAFSPDGHALASAGADRTLRVWDLRRGQLLYTLYGYVKAVKSIAFCPDSRQLVSGSDDQRVRLWDVASSGLLDGASGRALQTWAGHTSFIWQVAVSPDGRLVASAGDDRRIYVRDASNGQILKILSGHDSGATAVAFSPDSKLLASGGIDCRVLLWDVRAPWQVPTGRASGPSVPIRTWNGGTQVVWTVVFSPDGEYLAFGGEPNRVRLWHLPTQQFLPSLENETGVLRSLAFSPDSKWLAAVGHDALVYLWQMGSAAPPILLRGHQNRLRSVAFSPDGQRLATASFDQTVRLWDLQSQTQHRTLLGHSNQVLAVAFSSDGALLASASEDETIRLWDGKTGEPLSVLPMPGPYIGMKIGGVTGISAAQKAALRALGAVEA